MNGDEYLTIPELAARFKLGESTVKRYVAARKWPFTKVAGQVRFTPEHVAAILAAGDEPVVNAARSADVYEIRSRVRRSA